MNVLEGLKRKLAQRALRHMHKDRIAQFAKGHGHQPRRGTADAGGR